MEDKKRKSVDAKTSSKIRHALTLALGFCQALALDFDENFATCYITNLHDRVQSLSNIEKGSATNGL